MVVTPNRLLFEVGFDEVGVLLVGVFGAGDGVAGDHSSGVVLEELVDAHVLGIVERVLNRRSLPLLKVIRIRVGGQTEQT